jgi:secondary thiamine-phosphate synthase enzyme
MMTGCLKATLRHRDGERIIITAGRRPVSGTGLDRKGRRALPSESRVVRLSRASAGIGSEKESHMFSRFNIERQTTSKLDILDITPDIMDIIEHNGFRNGLVTVFIAGSTASITTIEFESGVVNDLRRAIEKLVPSDSAYEHDRRWGDGNGYSHVRAALMKPGISVPLIDGQLALGTWQQIVLLDFDNKPRHRRILLHIISDS